jgi:hypothetical protein
VAIHGTPDSSPGVGARDRANNAETDDDTWRAVVTREATLGEIPMGIDPKIVAGPTTWRQTSPYYRNNRADPSG